MARRMCYVGWRKRKRTVLDDCTQQPEKPWCGGWYNQTNALFPMPATGQKAPKASSWHSGLQPYFYVFIKGPDALPKDVHELVITCRHEAKRKEIKKQAVALAQALSIRYACPAKVIQISADDPGIVVCCFGIPDQYLQEFIQQSLRLLRQTVFLL